MPDPLADAIARHCTGWWAETAVPRLTLVAIDGPLEPVDVLYEPMVCFVVRGTKRSVAGDRIWPVRAGEMLFSTLDVPVTATFEEVPYRSAVLRIDRRVLTDLLLELGDAGPPGAPDPGGLATGPMPPELADAVGRLVRLLDTPGDIRPLAGRIETEILYRLLGGPLGPVLRQFALVDSRTTQVGTVAAWLRAHYAEPATVEDLAALAHMSVATLHRHFRVATGLSPLQFQKRLRLRAARRLLVEGELAVAAVADAVGYASATQFNREYRREYGVPPGRDAAALRSRLLPTHATA